MKHCLKISTGKVSKRIKITTTKRSRKALWLWINWWIAAVLEVCETLRSVTQKLKQEASALFLHFAPLTAQLTLPSYTNRLEYLTKPPPSTLLQQLAEVEMWMRFCQNNTLIICTTTVTNITNIFSTRIQFFSRDVFFWFSKKKKIKQSPVFVAYRVALGYITPFTIAEFTVWTMMACGGPKLSNSWPCLMKMYWHGALGWSAFLGKEYWLLKGWGKGQRK